MILRGLGPTPQYEDLEDVLYFILDNYQLQGIAVEYDEISIEDVGGLLIVVLRCTLHTYLFYSKLDAR